jgi:hypothetical protein
MSAKYNAEKKKANLPNEPIMLKCCPDNAGKLLAGVLALDLLELKQGLLCMY